MYQFLLQVEDRFAIAKRGLLLAPTFDDNKCGRLPTTFAVELHRPDGKVISAHAKINIIFDAGHPLCMVPPGLEPHDVPIGTEVWVEKTETSPSTN
jgi:hypothetical protein